MNKISKIKTNLKSKLSGLLYTHEIAEDSSVSNTYLVEYPKSGVTWLSTLIANYALILSEKDETATFFNVSQYVPDIHTSKRLGEKLYTKPSTRFVKSHAECNPYYVHVVYLVRHPLNVMKSYHKFLLGNNIQVPPFDEFIHDSNYGIPAWKRHVQGWLVNSNQVNHLHLMRYEDLRKNTFDTMSDLFENLGIKICEMSLNLAIERSSLQSMKKTESVYVKNNPRYKINFVGDGGVGITGGDEEYIDLINQLAQDELKLLGY